MIGMPTTDDEPGRAPEPGDRPTSPVPRESRRLAEAPSARYTPREGTRPTGGGASRSESALRGPLIRATLVALGGALLLTAVGAVLASTFGLLFAAGGAGAAIGLVLSRAAVPTSDATPVPRPRVARLAVALALGAVVVAAALTWIIARGEGGTLGIVDYLFETFGPFVPAEALLAALAAWWGAGIGPVQS